MKQIPDWGVPWDEANGVPFTEPGAGRPTLDRSTSYADPDRDFQDASQSVMTLGLTYDIKPGMTLSNRTRLSRTKNDYIVSAPERPDITTNSDPADWTLTASPKSRYQVNDVVSNTTELSFGFETGSASHDVVAGFSYAREKVSRQSYVGLTSEVGGGTAEENLAGCEVTIFNPDISACVGTPPVRSATKTITEVETTSLYVNDTITFNPKWELNLGARIDDYDISRKDNTGTSTPLSNDSTMFNWNAGLVWKPRENGSVYLSYATSSNPVGDELDGSGGSYSGIDEASAILDPEKNTSIELGTKWTFGNLLATAAVFQTEKDNARESTGRGATAVTTDSGKYRVRGIELSLGGNVTEKWSVFSGLTWMESEVLESQTPENIGREFANIAHEQFNVLVRYDHNEKWSLGGQATWRGSIDGGTFAATNDNKLPGFWRFDAMAEYHVSDRGSINFRIENLFDETYYDAMYRSGTPFVYIGPGRAASVSYSVKF